MKVFWALVFLLIPLSVRASQISNGSGTNTIPTEARQIMRDTSGNLWVVWIISTGTIRVASSTDGGSSFQLKDVANAPSNTNYKGVAAAIDSSDRIHITYWNNTLVTGGVRYVQFYTSSTVYGADQSILSIGAHQLPTTIPGTAVAVDSNGKLHVIYVDRITCCGAETDDTIYYIHNVAGPWVTPIRVEGAPDAWDCNRPDVMIDNNNLAAFSYWCGNTPKTATSIGNANNATSVTTINDFNSGGNSYGSSIVLDSSNNAYICAVDLSSNIIIYKHPAGGGWNTWNAGVGSGSVAIASDKVSCAAVGTNVYAFYILNSNSHVVYNKFNGTTWGGAVDLQAGTLQTPTVKWSQYSNNQPGKLDYIYGDGTNIFWESYTPPAVIIPQGYDVGSFDEYF